MGRFAFSCGVHRRDRVEILLPVLRIAVLVVRVLDAFHNDVKRPIRRIGPPDDVALSAGNSRPIQPRAMIAGFSLHLLRRLGNGDGNGEYFTRLRTATRLIDGLDDKEILNAVLQPLYLAIGDSFSLPDLQMSSAGLVRLLDDVNVRAVNRLPDQANAGAPRVGDQILRSRRNRHNGRVWLRLPPLLFMLFSHLRFTARPRQNSFDAGNLNGHQRFTDLKNALRAIAGIIFEAGRNRLLPDFRNGRSANRTLRASFIHGDHRQIRRVWNNRLLRLVIERRRARKQII